MTVSKLLSVIFCLALCCALSAPAAMASEGNQATKVTFNQSVEVPGRVLAGRTYWFTVMRDDRDQNIVQIWNADRTELLATILTVPDYRLEPKGRTVIKFEERPSSQPPTLQAWFYPGDNYGHEFVYPEARAKELAKRIGRPVLSMRDELVSNIAKPAKSAKEPSVMAMKQAHVQAVNPSGQEISMAKVVQQKPQK